MPVAPSASVRKGEGRYFGYTGVANVLDFTAMTVPMGKVDKSVDVRDESYQPIGDMDKEIWAQCKSLFQATKDPLSPRLF